MSDFYALSEEHQAIREAVRDLCDAKVAPYAAAVDEEARYPQEAADALLAADFHAPHVPEAHGGAGAELVVDPEIASAHHLRSGTTTVIASFVTTPIDVLADRVHAAVVGGAQVLCG